jgi:hypothetical protein
MRVRPLLRVPAAAVAVGALILLAIPGCRGSGAGTESGGRPAASTATAPSPTKAAQSPTKAAGPPAAAGPYCTKSKALSSKYLAAMGRAMAGRTPAEVKAGVEELVQNTEARAALAPPELRDSYRIILDDLRTIREKVERAGWSRDEARRLLSLDALSDEHIQASGRIAGYCG